MVAASASQRRFGHRNPFRLDLAGKCRRTSHLLDDLRECRTCLGLVTELSQHQPIANARLGAGIIAGQRMILREGLLELAVLLRARA